MNIIVHLFVSTLAVLVAGYVIPGVHIRGWFAALCVAVVLGVLNTFLRPILLFLTFPITVLTLGLFALVVNTLLILLAGSLVPGFSLDSFFAAFLFGIALFLVNAFFALFS